MALESPPASAVEPDLAPGLRTKQTTAIVATLFKIVKGSNISSFASCPITTQSWTPIRWEWWGKTAPILNGSSDIGRLRLRLRLSLDLQPLWGSLPAQAGIGLGTWSEMANGNLKILKPHEAIVRAFWPLYSFSHLGRIVFFLGRWDGVFALSVMVTDSGMYSCADTALVLYNLMCCPEKADEAFLRAGLELASSRTLNPALVCTRLVSKALRPFACNILGCRSVCCNLGKTRNIAYDSDSVDEKQDTPHDSFKINQRPLIIITLCRLLSQAFRCRCLWWCHGSLSIKCLKSQLPGSQVKLDTEILKISEISWNI